jgi:hypothetical protein
MADDAFAFEAELWEWDGDAAWHFFSVPEDVTDEIDERWGDSGRGFGAVKVEVTVGATTWRTSVFPDTKRGCYLLPVKKVVRTAEDLVDGSRAQVHLRVVTP